MKYLGINYLPRDEESVSGLWMRIKVGDQSQQFRLDFYLLSKLNYQKTVEAWATIWTLCIFITFISRKLSSIQTQYLYLCRQLHPVHLNFITSLWRLVATWFMIMTGRSDHFCMKPSFNDKTEEDTRMLLEICFLWLLRVLCCWCPGVVWPWSRVSAPTWHWSHLISVIRVRSPSVQFRQPNHEDVHRRSSPPHHHP